MSQKTYSVLLYTANDYQDILYGLDDTCEAACRELCRYIGIQPIANLLFSLRIKGSKNFLPGCRPVLPNVKYEFRLRHQIPTLSELKKMDRVAYNYYFHQVKHDLVNNEIVELEYPNHKDKVVGLIVTSMYIEMLEKCIKVEDLEKRYENYVPRKYIKKHGFIMKQRIFNELRNIKNMDHDSYYVKSTYLESINTLAPSYLKERYSGNVPYLTEDNFVRSGTCPVEIEFQPFHTERPGLSVYYAYKKLWRHIAKIDDIYAIIIDLDNTVILEIRDCPAGFSIQMTDKMKLESFVSCITTYYRLMVKWTVDLCRRLNSPTLHMLSKLKCHGPIGGEYAYLKLQERHCIPGAYIVRQCEKIYENFYIDIIISPNQIETFRITQKFDMWHLHSHEGIIKPFTNLTELAKSIETKANQKFRLAPSEYDKSASLLLCLPTYQLTAKTSINETCENEMRKRRAQLFHPVKDFRKYLNSQKEIEGGLITQMRADWILPEDKKLEVTLKILNSEKHLMEFMGLAEKWSNLFSSELIKMYGFTLSSPYTLVIESTKLGSLDGFLHKSVGQSISIAGLIDATHSLARALHYLQEKNIVHGRIRCASIYVIRYEVPNMILVRLGDPGFQKTYTKNDLPWIPFEYHNCMEQAKYDFKAEVWAYSTTIWEIFSRGRTPIFKEYSSFKRRLPKTNECPEEIYKIMQEGWNERPEKRFSPQMIFSKLMIAREQHSHSYSRPYPNHIGTYESNGSVKSTNTEQTHLTSQDDISFDSNGLESLENICNVSASSMSSDLLGDEESLHDIHSEKTIWSDLTVSSPDYSQSIFELDCGGVLIYQGKIGDGHYGSVYRGQYEFESHIQEVAVKRLKATPDANLLKDFEREIKIMQRLQHPNIVKIITWMDQPQILIVMEYVRHRSFLMYLSSQSPLLTTQRLLKFAKDIASGMEYLVSKKIVHRDLAARNILVDSDECVKISDFGLAQVADSNGYYVVRNSRDIPIKWYAPETLRSNKYSYASDVWSYGVTLYEMFSRGKEPNLVPGRDLPPIELLERLERGERLPRPNLCPSYIYESLLFVCWHENPRQRPDFTGLLEIIEDRISENGEDI